MMEVTQNRKHTSESLRFVGYFLLCAGFVWLCASAALLPMNLMAATTLFMSDGIPNKESYSRSEVTHALFQRERDIQQRLPWIFTPALAMLIAALILARSRT